MTREIKKPGRTGNPGMKIEFHGRSGVMHVTATFPISRLSEFTAMVAEQKRQWEQEGAGSAASNAPACADSETIAPPIFTFPKSSAKSVPEGFETATRSFFENPPRVATIALGGDK